MEATPKVDEKSTQDDCLPEALRIGHGFGSQEQPGGNTSNANTDQRGDDFEQEVFHNNLLFRGFIMV